jgi:hypothetical protein
MKLEELLLEFKAGDKVKWNSPQGEIHGTVKRKLTSPKKIKSHVAKPSKDKDDPQFLVVSDKTGAEASHKASSLKRA